MSIKAYFLLFMGVLVAAALAAASSVMLIENHELEEAWHTERMIGAFGAILSIQQHASSERGHFNARLLGSDTSAENEQRITAITDQAFATCIGLLRGAPGTEFLVDRIEQIQARFLALRAFAVARLDASHRNTDTARTYVDDLIALMGQLEAVADRAEREATASAQPLARSYIDLARLAAIMRDYAGRRASRMVGLVATDAPVTAEIAGDLGQQAGRVHAMGRRLEQIADVSRQIAAAQGTAFPVDLQQTIEAMQQLYFGDIEAMYGQIIKNREQGASSSITSAQLRARHIPAIETSSAIRAAALAQAAAAAARDARDARVQLLKAIGLLVFIIVTSTLGVLVLRGKVISPLTALTRIVVRLAENDRAVTVPELTRRDEIGLLAHAIETLRTNAERAAAVERERQMMETQLRQAQKLEALGTLAGGIAHEINTPTQYVGDNIRFLETSFADLRTVLEHAAALRAAAEAEPRLAALASALHEAATAADLDFLRDEIPTAITQSLDGVDRIRQIVLAVKEFSHPDVKEVTPLDLNRAIETTITVSRNQWKYLAELDTALAPDLPPVPCRGGEINQVFLNLIVNAAHAIEAKGDGTGRITVATRHDGDWAEIRVSDTGTGMTPELIARIFDPFFTTKAPGKGTGQGLAICHAIVVQKHGGSIAVDSKPGEGTCFIVRLPLTAAPEAMDGLGLAA
ncbi:MAG: HAMP domain-containing protein [Proteobacteria bacterium]|nr:HAMP domain-containing protein [Pseudomonadota bacterium]